MKKRYYVVVRGRKPGIYRHWEGADGAAAQVLGFAGARFRGFPTYEEALRWAAQMGVEVSPRFEATPAEIAACPTSSLEAEVHDALQQGKVVIFTDGSASPNPGPGGYGAVLRYGEHRREISGGEPHTTNNRMELRACIEALRRLKRPSEVVLYSDSRYLVESMNSGRVRGWHAQGWRNERGEKVKNADLWAELLALCQRHKVTFRWIRGHAGHPDNERCDRLAKAALRATS